MSRANNLTNGMMALCESHVRFDHHTDTYKRGVYLVLTPLSLITSALDTIIGVGTGVAACLSGGRVPGMVPFAVTHLAGAKTLAALPYLCFLYAINPKALTPSGEEVAIPFEGNGLTSHLVLHPLKREGEACSKSPHFLTQHVVSRLTYAVLALACLVTRAVDGLIGIPAGVLALVTGGAFPMLNNVAYRALQAPGIIEDLFYCTFKVMNPWVKTGV